MRALILRWALGLGLGFAGGGAFAAIDLPLPWMLGALAATSAAALSGWSPGVPGRLRAVMITVLGLVLGSAFSPELLDRIPRWSLSMAVLFAAMALTTVLVIAHLRRSAAMDRVTAFFAGTPGGLNEMVLIGTAMGGDERAIAMSHSLRIILIVFTVPFGYRLISHVQSIPMTQSMGRLVELGGHDALALAGMAAAGVVSGWLLRLPAWTLTGPMLLSAGLHLAGITAAKPPAEIVILAQVTLGASIGSRFCGMGWTRLGEMARPALGATAIMLVIAGGAAGGLAALSDLPFSVLLLSFVPGGIAEMCLVALALGQDVAFVSTHHTVRVMLIILIAPVVFRTLWRKGSSA